SIEFLYPLQLRSKIPIELQFHVRVPEHRVAPSARHAHHLLVSLDRCPFRRHAQSGGKRRSHNVSRPQSHARVRAGTHCGAVLAQFEESLPGPSELGLGARPPRSPRSEVSRPRRGWRKLVPDRLLSTFDRGCFQRTGWDVSPESSAGFRPVPARPELMRYPEPELLPRGGSEACCEPPGNGTPARGNSAKACRAGHAQSVCVRQRGLPASSRTDDAIARRGTDRLSTVTPKKRRRTAHETNSSDTRQEESRRPVRRLLRSTRHCCYRQ